MSRISAVLLLTSLSLLIFAAPRPGLHPPSVAPGAPKRIAYFEGGVYPTYTDVLKATLQGLVALDWLAYDPDFEALQTSHAVWQWAVAHSTPVVQFVPDAYYSSGWNVDRSTRDAATLLARTDLDLIIAAGTRAGQLLAVPANRIPTLVISTTNAVEAGISASVEFSGHPMIHAATIPHRQRMQVALFHDIFQFQRLGLARQFTPEGDALASIDDLLALAAERHFAIIQCATEPNPAQADASVLRCLHDFVARGVDAVYLIQQNGVNATTVPEFAKVLRNARIVSFSQLGSEEVAAGVLLSLSLATYADLGRFEAQTMAYILNGVPPGDLSQRYVMPPSLAINLTTAEAIGVDIPAWVLEMADEIFY